MSTFALIAEGLTDQIVLEKIIEEICGEAEEEFEVQFLQPLRDETDAYTAPHGGWGLVFEYCQYHAADALATNDYLIIQIDTDCGDLEGFGLPLTEHGAPRSYHDLIDGASAILVERIGHALYNSEKGRIIFAVAVHSIESWLILILFDDENTLTGYDRLKAHLRKGRVVKFSKNIREYTKLIKIIKRKRLVHLSKSENSLGVFLMKLNNLVDK